MQALLIDIDGVVTERGRVVAGAAEAIGRLRLRGIPFRFLTNTTSEPRRLILERLVEGGIAVDPSHVITPAAIARAQIERLGLDPFLLIREVLEEDFAGLQTGARPAVVIADAGDRLTYASLNRAFRLLEKGAAFLALAANRSFMDKDGERSIDVGAFVAALEYATGRQARVLGKPAAAFFHGALREMGIAPEHAAMIGDDAEFDVSAAVAAGLEGHLVRTGKWRPGDEARIEHKPTAVHADLAAAIDVLLAGPS
jgi:HAD superfamily hydrolase (TIGR01458 family)